jgi:lipoprotein NlpI
LYKGQASVGDVLAAAKAGDPPADVFRERLFYAHLYVGLYYEAAGDAKAAREYIAKAAGGGIEHYMGDVARVHMLVQFGKNKRTS